jgi:hypothetical protein
VIRVVILQGRFEIQMDSGGPGKFAVAIKSGWRAGLAVPRWRRHHSERQNLLEEFMMRHRFTTTAAACALALSCLAGAASAQAPAAPVSSAVASPTYASIPLEIVVNRPAAEVWKRVGKFCDIGEWLQLPCTITSGKDGEFGAVRSVGGEVLVGKTELSYTYTQTVNKDGRPYNLYHGTLEARPETPTTTKLVYTIFFDNSMLADDAAREADRARRTAAFTRALQNMKTLCEGGTLPPPPARGTPPPATAQPRS